MTDWLVQIVSALGFMHAQTVLHRDLKTANIFLTARNLVKVGDFGVSKIMPAPGQLARTAIGTPYYLAPELVNGEQYGFKADMWALGVVLYELMTLRAPPSEPPAAMLSECTRLVLSVTGRCLVQRRACPLAHAVAQDAPLRPTRCPPSRCASCAPSTCLRLRRTRPSFASSSTLSYSVIRCSGRRAPSSRHRRCYAVSTHACRLSCARSPLPSYRCRRHQPPHKPTRRRQRARRHATRREWAVL